MKLKAVIFDMDGVLIDSEPLWEEAETKLLKSKGIKYDPLFGQKVVGMSQSELSKKIIRRFGLKCSPEDLTAERLEILFEIYDKKLRMFEGARRLVENLRELGLKTALASGSPMKAVLYALEKFSIGSLFDAAVSGDCVKKGKPDPEIYLRAASEIGVSPSQCAAVEDSPRGAQSAVSAGMLCIAVADKRFKARRFENCAAVCENIADVEKTVKRRAFFQTSKQPKLK